MYNYILYSIPLYIDISPPVTPTFNSLFFSLPVPLSLKSALHHLIFISLTTKPFPSPSLFFFIYIHSHLLSRRSHLPPSSNQNQILLTVTVMF